MKITKKDVKNKHEISIEIFQEKKKTKHREHARN